MKRWFCCLALLFVSIAGFSQDNDLPNRDSFNLKLAVDDINFYNSLIKPGPYVLPENTIQIYPGEKIYIEIELDKNQIKGMKTVKENLHPEKTMTISFKQETDGKVHKGMMLSIQNPFEKTLTYKARMFLMKYNKWANTSTVPIGAGLTSFETWSDIVVTLALTGWKFE